MKKQEMELNRTASRDQAVYVDLQSPFNPEDHSADIGESDTLLDKLAQLVRQNKLAVFSALVILAIIILAVFAPVFSPYDPAAQSLRERLAAPSAEHWLGTDKLGRDILSRIIYGARVSLVIGLLPTFISMFIGTILGLFAGYYGGKTDFVIMRLADIMLAFPSLLLAMTIVAILGNGLFNTAVAIAVFSIPSVARMVRGVVIGLRDSQYISACHVMGESNVRIIGTHIIPNAISQIIVNITLNLGTAILTASSLSFLGLGVQPPNPEWGAMLSKARDVLRYNPAEAIFPGIAITLVVMSFSLVGDGLRDALDPKLKNVS